MNYCNKSKNGAHNFSIPGEDCANGCQVNQYQLSGFQFKKAFGEVRMSPSDFDREPSKLEVELKEI